MIMKSKGQTLVFEQMLMFTVGIVILLTSVALFMMYQTFYVSETAQDQITQVKEYIMSSIIKLCENEEFNSSTVIEIPKTLGGSLYRISLTDSSLNITQEPEGPLNDFSPLYGLNETFSFGGMAISDVGRVVLYKRGTSVVLDRSTG